MMRLKHRFRGAVTVFLLSALLVGFLLSSSSMSSALAGDLASEQGAFAAAPMDWPHWRGPEMNGISRETNLVTRWKQRPGPGSNLLWFNKELGGRSTPIVMNGLLYMMVRDQPGTKREGEKVVCVDAATGEKQWQSRFNVFQSDVPDSRVGWSSLAGDPQTGRVYALGVCGYFQCLDGKTGKVLWSHSLSEEYGLLSTYGGRTNFPVIHGNLVIISAIIIDWGKMAKPAHRFIAFDKRNGQPVWFKGTRLFPYDTTYSSPILTVLKGQPYMIFGSGDGGVHAFQPQTGRKIWSYQISSKRGVNTSPLIVGNRVFIGHSEENVNSNTMGALLSVMTETGKKVWRKNEWYVGKSSPLEVGGRIYAAEIGGTLRIVDAKSGKLISTFKLRGPMHSSPIYADGKIYVCTINGRWWTLEPTKTGVKVLYRMRLSSTEVYGSPIVSHGRLYIPTTGGLYCVGKKGQKSTAGKRPAPPREADPQTDPKPVQLQLVPVESLLRPGQTQQFDVRLYNSRGQFLKVVDAKDVKFSASGPGSIDKSGNYTTPDPLAKKQHAAVTVTATVQGMTGTARIRLVPDLPWNIDFNDGKIPVTWVGVRYRHIPLDYTLYKKLAGEKKSLLAARLYIFLQTGMINGQPTNRPGLPGFQKGKLVYNNRSPKRTFAALTQYLGLEEKTATLANAKKILDPLLSLLAAEKVIGKHVWSSTTGIQLVIDKVARKTSGEGVMVKIKTIPKGQRSQGWMGHPDFFNYTIQADVLGTERVSVVQQGPKKFTVRKMPDIGIAGQRYVLDLMGAKQQLQIRTWHPQLRMSQSAPFTWKPNVWYTLKLRVSVVNGKANVFAKCWERSKKEPQKWLLEATDETPNENGSPGFYGNAVDAEIFYDNIKVYKNK